MTVERAYYHKLMLEVGLTERFDQELDTLLEQEDPLSELTLALSTCGGDRNEQIHILNDYILSVPKEQIDSDAVFSLVAEDFRTRYEQSPETLEQLTRQMGSAAWLSGWWTEDPWNAMYLMSDWYDDIEDRLLRMVQHFRHRILLVAAFLADIPAGLQQLPQRAFLLRQGDVGFNVGGGRHLLDQLDQIAASADPLQASPAPQFGVQGCQVDRGMVPVQLRHRGEDLPVFRLIEIVRGEPFQRAEHGIAVLEHRTQNADLRLHAVGRHDAFQFIPVLHTVLPLTS